MLKKLFISLMILSTLASEGIMNFPKDIYNFLACLNNDTLQNFSLKEKAEVPQKASENKLTYTGLLKLTVNTLQKFREISETKYLYKSKDSSGFLLNRPHPSFHGITPDKAFETKKEIVLLTSDTSPPLI